MATTGFEPLGAVPISAAILLVLFLVQRSGTARVGAVFGPVMVIWFVCDRAAGPARTLPPIPRCSRAINPDARDPASSATTA